MTCLSNRFLLVIIATIALAPACQKASDKTSDNEVVQVNSVVTTPAEEIDLRQTVEISGEVRPWAAVTVAAETAGRVVELNVEVGNNVSQGELIVALNKDTAQTRLDMALAEMARAEVTMSQAKRDLERGQRLAETSDISDGDLDRMQLAHDTAAAQLAILGSRIRLAEQNLDDTNVTAPFAGTVAQRLVELGSWIQPGSPVIRLLDQRQLKIAGAASQRDRARIRVGLAVEVQAAALANELFTGQVRLLGQDAEAATGTYLVEVAVPRPAAPSGARLLPGMQARMTISLGLRRALVVPRGALVTTADGKALFVVADDLAHLRLPGLGIEQGDKVEILSGLVSGELVVVAGQHGLSDGCQVRIARESRP